MEVPTVSTNTEAWEDVDLWDDVTLLDGEEEAEADSGVQACCKPYRSGE